MTKSDGLGWTQMEMAHVVAEYIRSQYDDVYTSSTIAGGSGDKYIHAVIRLDRVDIGVLLYSGYAHIGGDEVQYSDPEFYRKLHDSIMTAKHMRVPPFYIKL